MGIDSASKVQAVTSVGAHHVVCSTTRAGLVVLASPVGCDDAAAATPLVNSPGVNADVGDNNVFDRGKFDLPSLFPNSLESSGADAAVDDHIDGGWRIVRRVPAPEKVHHVAAHARRMYVAKSEFVDVYA